MEFERFFSRFSPRWRYLIYCLLIGAAYYTLARGGLLLATINRSASPIWPASGLAIALLSRVGFRCAPAIAIAAFFANIQTGIPFVAALVIALGNTLEAIVGSLIFDRLGQQRKTLFGTETTFVAMCAAAVFATPISATIASAILVATEAIASDTFGTNWLTWWIGDTLGMLLFAPFFMRLFRDKPVRWLPSARWITVALLAGAASLFVFFYVGVPAAGLFVVYPFIFLAVYALTPSEAGLVTIVIAAVAIWSTATGRGPFVFGSTNENLICIALFLATLAITEQGIQFIKENGNIRISAPFLASGWLISAAILHGFARHEGAVDQARFENLVDGTMNQFRQRAFLYEAALRGGVGLFKSSDRVTRRNWKTYVDNLDVDKNYPGIHGLGYIRVVPHTELDSFIREIRSQGDPNFRYQAHEQPGIAPPPESRNVHYVITSVEPRERNKLAIGLDIATESIRFEGANRAARSGRPEVTRPIRLVHDTKQRTGFLLLLSIFRDGRLVGWVYAPLTIDAFLGNAFQFTQGEIALQLYFDENGNEPIYTDLPEKFDKEGRSSIRREQPLWGKNLVFLWYPTAAFNTRRDTTSTWVIFVCAF